MSIQNSVTQINEQIDSHETATNQAETIQQINLRAECNKTPYLDGKFFEVDFEKSSEDGSSVYATCVHCIPKQYIKGSLKISSNYVSHMKFVTFLKRKHPDLCSEYNIYKNAKRQRMERSNIIRRTTCIFSQELFEENVTRYILESMSPSSTVVLPAFRQMFDSFRIKHGDKPLKHLAQNTLKKKINIIYSEQMKILKNHLRAIKYVCTTADVWTAPDRRIIGVTAHWLCEKTLKRKSAALACKRIEGTHTAEVIALELARIYALFGLNNEKIVATVTDNGSNFIKAFKIFGLSNSSILEIESLSANNVDELEKKETSDSVGMNSDEDISETDEDNNENNNENDEYNDDINNYDNIDNVPVDSEEISDEIDIILPRHLRCASHTLHLIASSDAMKIIKDDSKLKRLHEEAIEQCEKLWRKLRSLKNRETLKKYLKCALKRPVVTRWNSLYDCLKQIISLQDKFISVDIQQHVDFEVGIKEHHLRYIKDYLTCVEPLALGIDKAQAETTCYYGCLLPLLLSIKNKWNKMLKDNNLVYCRKLVEGMQLRLVDRFHDFFKIRGQGEAAALAAITHPQFKDRWLVCLSHDKIVKVQQLISTAFSDSENERNEIPKESMELDDFFYFGEDTTHANRRSQLFICQGENSLEILRFLNNPINTLDVLDHYPQVKRMFIKYNTCIPSSAPVERLFSYATMMNIPKYNRLSDDFFEKRVLAAANMKKRYL